MAVPSGPAEGAGNTRPRVLIVALVVQLVLAAVAIFFAVNGWPFVGGGRDAQPVAHSADADPANVPTRFQAGAQGDGVQTPRVDRFDSAAAFALLRRQVERYGWRPAGSASLRRLA